jgi:hypothetical protein
MKGIKIVLATAAVLVGCDDGRAAQGVLAPPTPAIEAAVAANGSDAVSFETVNPCNGEMITMWGTMHFVSRAASDGNGGLHIGGQGNARFEGTGQSTGTTYVASFTTPFSINVRPPYPVTVSDVFNVNFVGRGGVTNFSGHRRFFMTVNANGDVTVDRGGEEEGEIEVEFESLTCQGASRDKG